MKGKKAGGDKKVLLRAIVLVIALAVLAAPSYAAKNKSCGNSVCEPLLGETSLSCLADCPETPASGPDATANIKENNNGGTFFGQKEESLNYFLKKKAEKVRKTCFGCRKIFVDLSSADITSASPSINPKKALSASETLTAEVKLVGSFSETKGTPARVLIEAENSSGIAQAVANIKALKGKVRYAETLGNIISAEIPENTALKLAATPEVAKVYRDIGVSALLSEAKSQANALMPATEGFTGEGVRVAVVDTGIEKNNPSLQGKVVAEADFSGEGTPNDLHGHGTFIAGIIAGSDAGNGFTEGIAPGAGIINAKALGSSGKGSVSSVIQAIAFSLNPDNNEMTSDGARIINLSFGTPQEINDSPLFQVLREAEALGAVVVVSAGNCGFEEPDLSCNGFTGITFPGNSESALTVGVVDENNYFTGFSSRGVIPDYGPKPDIVAPGTNVSGPWVGGKVSVNSGTSASAAIVSGIAALILEKSPLLSPKELKLSLLRTAKDLGVKGMDELYGYGLADAGAALESLSLVASNQLVLTRETNETIGLEDANFFRKIRLFYGGTEPVKIKEYLADDWLKVSYPIEIKPGTNQYLFIGAEQKQLGVGTHSTELLLAVDDYVVSHRVTLNVVEGVTDFNGDTELEIEISKPSNITVEGTDASGKVGRGKTLTLKAQYANPTSFDSGYYYGALQVQGPSPYLCDTAPQYYFHGSNVGKVVNFSYTVPSNAPLGNYSAKSFSWETCSGQQYDGLCHSSSSYSCVDPPYVNEYQSGALFEVISGCTSGACCNLNFNTFKPSTSVCGDNVSTEYRCEPKQNNSLKGADVQVNYNDQYCSGSGSACDGGVLNEEKWSTFKQCNDNEICNLSALSCDPDPVTCYYDSDCGPTGWTSTPSCSLEKVVQEYTTSTCVNPKTLDSYCQSSKETREKVDCSAQSLSCVDGA
ncbi:MAG TPA: S8 family serine peptidase, partial [archaeon]|nr:S8 family serine peptidase [archaeon]